MNKRWLCITLAMILSCSAAFTTITLNKGNSGGNNMDYEVPVPPPSGGDGTGDGPNGGGNEEELPPVGPETPGGDVDPDDGKEEPEIPLPPPEEEDPGADVDGVEALPFYTDAMPNIAILGEVPALGAVLKAVPAPVLNGSVEDTLFLADAVTAEELEAALLFGVTATDGNGETLPVTLYKLGDEPYSSALALRKDGKTRTVTLQATDRFGRTVSLKREFHIVVAPEIVVDNADFYVEDGAIRLFLNEVADFDPYAGVTVLDPNGRLSETSLLLGGSVDLTTAGTYELTYSLDDAYNPAVSAVRTVVVRERNAAEIVELYETLENKLAESSFTSTKKGVIFNRYQPFMSYNLYTPFQQELRYDKTALLAETYLKNNNESHFSSTARRAFYNFADGGNAVQSTSDFTASKGIATDKASALKPPSYQEGKMIWDGSFDVASWNGEIIQGSDTDAFNKFAMTNVAAEQYRMLLYRLSADTIKSAAYSWNKETGTGTITFALNVASGAENAAVSLYVQQIGEIYGYAPEDFYASSLTVTFETDSLRMTSLDGYEEFKSGFHSNPDTKNGEAKLKYAQTFSYGDVSVENFAPAAPEPQSMKARIRALTDESADTPESGTETPGERGQGETPAETKPVVGAEALTIVRPAAETLYNWLYAGIHASDADLYAVGIKTADADDFAALEEGIDLAPFCAAGDYVVRYYAANAAGYVIYDRHITIADRIDSANGAHYYARVDRSAPVVTAEPTLMTTPVDDAETFVKLLSKDVSAEGGQVSLYSVTASDGTVRYFGDESADALEWSSRADVYRVKYYAAGDNGNYTIYERTVTISAKPQFSVDYTVYAEGETDEYQGVTRVILTPDDKPADEAALRALALRGVSVLDPTDPELTLANAQIDSTIDFNKEGTYYVRIKVANASGAEASLIRYFYYKNPAPVITVDNTVFAGVGEVKKASNGAEYIELRPDANFGAIDLGAGIGVRDELDDSLTAADVTTEGALDASKLGAYQTITYRVTNANGVTGIAYRNFLIRDYTVEELADSVAVYNKIAARMATETYFQKSQGKTTAKTAFTNSSLSIYGTMDVTPGEMYFENVSSGDPVVGVNVSFAKRVWLKQNGASWSGSYGAVEKQDATAALIDSAWAYTYKSWTGGGAKAYTDGDFLNDFGRPVGQLFCYPITAETLSSTAKEITKENNLYKMKLTIDVSKSAAIDGYKKQVSTISGQTVKSFNYANLTLTFDSNYRLLQYAVSEEYVVTTMSAKTTNSITYVNYFNPEGFRVRSF